MQWIDLSPHGLRMAVFHNRKNGRNQYAVAGSGHGAELRALGFKWHDRAGVWLKSPPLSISDVAARFPNAKRTQVDARDVVFGIGKRPEPTGPDPDKRRFVGLNRHLDEVHEEEDGTRVAVSKRGGESRETAKAAAPDAFLRAPDFDSLALCASSLVARSERGEELSSESLDELAAATGEAWTRANVGEALAHAAARRLAAGSATTMRESYRRARDLEARLPLPEGSPSLPLSVAIQRVAAAGGVEGKAVVMEGAAAGSLLTNLDHPTRLRVCGSDAGDVAHAQAVARVNGLPAGEINDTELDDSDWSSADLAISSMPRTKDGPSSTSDGETFERGDYASLKSKLSKRADGARSVVTVDGPDGPAETEEFERLRTWVAENFAVEGTAKVQPEALGREPDGAVRYVFAVGGKRPEPVDDIEPALRVREVSDPDGLWTWVAEAMRNRAKIAEMEAKRVESQSSDLDRNHFQTPYESASSLGQSSTMMPKNLEAATRAALDRVSKGHGDDVDGYVATELGMTRDELSKAFSPEQIDALALNFDAHDRERAFLLADDTGIGKGRVLAAVARRAALKGKKVLYVTESVANLSDFWRDVRHIGADDDLSPFVMNDGASLVDETTGEPVAEPTPKAAVQRAVRERDWPEGSNLVLTTYSQHSGKVDDAEGAPHAKSAWIRSAVDENVWVIEDESHNAASATSNRAANMAAAVEKAGALTCASATFAKNARTLRTYKGLFPEGVDTEALAEALSKGGETIQEVMAEMLVTEGVMIRREHDLRDAEFTFDTDAPERVERNRQHMDALAPVLAAMAYLSGDMDRVVNQRNKNLWRRHRQGEISRQQFKRMRIGRMAFGSPLYLVSRLFVLGLKVDGTVERAVSALERGEKPVVMLENTCQTLLAEFADDARGEDGREPEFKDVVHRVLDRMAYGSRNGQTIDMRRDNPEFAEAIRDIKAMVDELPHMPMSPIDEIQRRIAEAGYSVEEITGRSLRWDGQQVVRRQQDSRARINSRFNNGQTDAAVLNTAGMTGISLHAGARFKDQRKRVGILTQPPADISKEKQGHGRIGRFDQVVPPRLESFSTGLPAEDRFNAMRNKALKALSANVTSNRENAALFSEVPDMMNAVGDAVVTAYCDMNPDVVRRLGLKEEDVDRQETDYESLAEHERDQKRSANQFLARLMMLSSDEQQRIAGEVEALFRSHLEELDELGQNPLVSQTVNGVLHLGRERLFEGAPQGEAASVFHQPVTVTEAVLERQSTPLRGKDIARMVEDWTDQAGAMTPDVYADRLERRRMEILGPFLPANVTTPEDAEAVGAKRGARRMRKLDATIDFLKQVRPGAEIVSTSEDGTPAAGVVLGLEPPKATYEHLPSAYGVWFVRPGDPQPKTIRLENLLNDDALELRDGLAGDDYDGLIRRFDEAPEGTVKETREILGGNPLQAATMAADHKLGAVRMYMDSDGVLNRGVILSRRANNLDQLPVRMDSPDMAVSALAENGAWLADNQELEPVDVQVAQRRDGGFRVALPSRNRNKRTQRLYENEGIRELAAMKSNRRGSPKIEIERENLDWAVNALWDAGVRFYASSECRDWANAWRGEAYAANRPDDAPDSRHDKVELDEEEDAAFEAVM